eukprot:3684036-Alexandrium_andersonii.AAC.1
MRPRGISRRLRTRGARDWRFACHALATRLPIGNRNGGCEAFSLRGRLAWIAGRALPCRLAVDRAPH